MLFSVVYSIDAPANCIQDYYPPKSQQKEWNITEKGRSEDVPGWRHRKFAALLTAKQFREFVECTGLEAESTRTMGCIGAPGMGYGCSPAISFNGKNGVYQNAYVCPIPNKLAEMRFKKWEAAHPFQLSNDPESANNPDKPMLTERDWERMRLLIFRAYGDDCAQREAEEFGDTVNMEEGVQV